jgi:hypothetical protein
MSSSTVETTSRAIDVQVSDDELIVSLVDGRRICVPLVWFPKLLQAPADKRAKWELLGDGEGIHWPLIDEDLTVEGLLSGRRSLSK